MEFLGTNDLSSVLRGTCTLAWWNHCPVSLVCWKLCDDCWFDRNSVPTWEASHSDRMQLSESMSFPNAVKTDWNPYVYPRSHCYMISSCFFELWTCSAEDAIFPVLCVPCAKECWRGASGWSNGWTVKQREAGKETDVAQSWKQVLFHEQKITKDNKRCLER